MEREKGVGERDAEGEEEGNGKEGRRGVGVMDFGKVVKSRPGRSFLTVGAYAPHSQQSSSDKCNDEVGFRNGQKV